jgi:hypothetical protein
MRLRRGAIGCLALGLSAVVCTGQAVRSDARGTVLVWWVEASTQAQRDQIVLEHIVPSVPRIPLDQRSASELGQNASTFGQNAGGYGQNAGSYGTNASDFGQNASTAGRPASEVGHAASDTGQTAGSYGQTAGSFGQTASTFGVAASDTDKLPKPHGPEPVTLTTAQQKLGERLRLGMPGMNVQVVPVLDLVLAEKLAAAERTASYPDLVVGGESSMLGQSGASQVSLASLPLAAKSTHGEVPASAAVQQSLMLMRRAPHPAQARALVAWMQRSLGH